MYQFRGSRNDFRPSYMHLARPNNRRKALGEERRDTCRVCVVSAEADLAGGDHVSAGGRSLASFRKMVIYPRLAEIDSASISLAEQPPLRADSEGGSQFGQRALPRRSFPAESLAAPLVLGMNRSDGSKGGVGGECPPLGGGPPK